MTDLQEATCYVDKFLGWKRQEIPPMALIYAACCKANQRAKDLNAKVTPEGTEFYCKPKKGCQR